jgi:ABC-type molybdate transport system substrate-binding protein
MLARQIEESAPADVFISQMKAQMDRLHKQIAPNAQDLLTNKLVVVIGNDSSARIDELADLTKRHLLALLWQIRRRCRRRSMPGRY